MEDKLEYAPKSDAITDNAPFWNETGQLTIPEQSNFISINGECFVRMGEYHKFKCANKKLLKALKMARKHYEFKLEEKDCEQIDAAIAEAETTNT